MKPQSTYQEIKPSKELDELVHSFWTHDNSANEPQKMTIFPDSFFKIIFYVSKGKITNFFMVGLWTEPKEIVIPPETSSYGCRLKILAPEFLLNQEIASIINSLRQLKLSFLNLDKFNHDDFNSIVKQWETELIKIKPVKQIQGNKLRLSQLLYKKNGSISASEVSKQVFWTNRQINRYLNKYLGVSLKKYLNIQKCYESYIQIGQGSFFPEKDYFDQAHFIKEVKKHTGETPSSLYKEQNDRFIQLKNIKRK